MKNNIGIFIIALLAIACNPHSEEHFSIQGEVFGSTDGEMICLSYPIKRDGIWYKQCDTTYINGGHFAKRSMLPKIEASLEFVSSSPGKKAIIGSLEKASEAINGNSGTIIE